MKYGICCGLDAAANALAAGFDYVEVATSGYATQATFDAGVYRSARAEASNVFFPGTIRLFGDASTPYMDYVAMAVDRAAEIGIETLVIGSGAARTAPLGIDAEQATIRFAEIAAEISSCASKRGIMVAPESLGRAETNVGTDLGKLAYLLRQHGVAYTADSYHVLYEWQADGGLGSPWAELWEAQIPFLPAHVHLGGLPRVAPWDDPTLLEGFAARLKALGYGGRVSVEAALAGTDIETLKQILHAMKSLFA